MAESSELFCTLQDLSRRFDECTRGLPAQTDLIPTRLMVCFSLLGANLAIALEEVAEILELPAATKLPRVKPWVKGVTNLHGRLLPLVSFAEFLGGRTKTTAKKQRVMVLQNPELYVGLIVDRVIGMKHFKLDAYSYDIQSSPEMLKPYLDGVFRFEQESWYVFRSDNLVGDESFRRVAA